LGLSSTAFTRSASVLGEVIMGERIQEMWCQVKHNHPLRSVFDEFLRATFLDMFGDPVTNDKYELQSLSENLELVSGYAFKSSDYTEFGVPLVKIGTINNGIFDDSNLSFLPYTFLSMYEKYKLVPNDLVISLTGTCRPISRFPPG
jgi:hypothetical protein